MVQILSSNGLGLGPGKIFGSSSHGPKPLDGGISLKFFWKQDKNPSLLILWMT